jgi:hypothetical protein
MSYNLTASAIESDLRPNDRLVFIALAHCANDSTYCFKKNSWKAWPGINRLIKYTGLSKSSVQRALKSLVKSGDIKIDHRKQTSHRNLSNVYTLFEPNRAANAPSCISEEVAPPEDLSSNKEGATKTPTPHGVGVTEIKEGVRVTPEQINKTNNKNIYYAREREDKAQAQDQFDPRIPPHGVVPKAWSEYLDMLNRRNRPLPDQQQHRAQGQFLGEFDPITQKKIVQQSVRNGWVSLHPVANVRAIRPPAQRSTRERSVFEQLTDRSWADGCFEDLSVVVSV